MIKPIVDPFPMTRYIPKLTRELSRRSLLGPDDVGAQTRQPLRHLKLGCYCFSQGT